MCNKIIYSFFNFLKYNSIDIEHLELITNCNRGNKEKVCFNYAWCSKSLNCQLMIIDNWSVIMLKSRRQIIIGTFPDHKIEKVKKIQIMKIIVNFIQFIYIYSFMIS